MKEGWEYKKLGEVATFVNGYPFKPSDWKGNGRKIIRIQNLNNPTAEYNYYDGSIDSKYLVIKGDVLISWSGSLGVFEWSKDEAILNQHIFKVVFNKGKINKRFFEYVVSSRLNEMKAKVHGITMQHITKKDFDVIPIPIPPLPEQERIVSELDLLTSIINKQKAQLKELDSLAQSIFYNMFGDPIENPKGWEVKKLGEVVDITSSLIDPNQEPYCYQYHVSPANILSGTGEILECNLAKDDMLISGKYAFEKGMILYSKIRPNLNKVAIAPFNGICSADMYPLSIKEKANNVFICRLLLGKHFLEYAIKESGRARMPKINRESLFAYTFPLPPLSLQQSFASEIEAIETQKALITKSMEETQRLFDSRMDYWFA